MCVPAVAVNANHRTPNLVSALVHAATLESLMTLARESSTAAPAAAATAAAAPVEGSSSSAAPLAAFVATAKVVLDKSRAAMLLTAEAGERGGAPRLRACDRLRRDRV